MTTNTGKKRGLLFTGHGQNTQPHFILKTLFDSKITFFRAREVHLRLLPPPGVNVIKLFFFVTDGGAE
jgi:hypothetical protein